ncbi:MAG: GNAT family N-acetyltransferase [Burkholderiaceae bacterium]
MKTLEVITADDDLGQLADDINGASWDEVNDFVSYSAESLVSYLKRQDTVLLVCYETTGSNKQLLGLASARIQIKPYANEQWLYVDEVDVCADQRRKGVGKAMMARLVQIAREAGCHEVWLGTETDNVPANALYSSLNPDESELFIGYAYSLEG